MSTRYLRRASLLVAVAALTAPFTAAQTAAAAGQRYMDPIFPAISVVKNIGYGRAANSNGALGYLMLDLYRPKKDTLRLRPLVIYAHGGAWRGGDKANLQDRLIVENLAHRGFLAASINFRLNMGEEAATDDLQAAVRWARETWRVWGINTKRIVVMGSSSGANSALVATFEPERPGASGYGGHSSRVAGGVSIGGAVLRPSIIGPDEPPIGMIHALGDSTIPYAAARSTCSATMAQGNDCQMYTHVEGGHPPAFVLLYHERIVEEISDFVCRFVIGCPKLPPPPLSP